jgi:hypothetical protein
LKRKLCDPEVRDFVKKFGIFVATETWLSKDKEIELENYELHSVFFERRSRKGRHPGGTTVFVRKDLAHKTKRVGEFFDSESIIWLKVESEHPFLLGAFYFQPIGSPYEDKNCFDTLAEQLDVLLEMHGLEHFVLMGDANARVGEEAEISQASQITM